MVKVTKTPAETRSHMTEIDRMAKLVFEVTGRAVSDESMKGVLVGSLDPVTRQMTAHLHGVDTSTEELRNHISRFTSNVAIDGNAMQLGALGGSPRRRWRP